MIEGSKLPTKKKRKTKQNTHTHKHYVTRPRFFFFFILNYANFFYLYMDIFFYT